MREYVKASGPYLKCPATGCRKTRSVRATNSFFFYKKQDGTPACSLSLCDILELVYNFTSCMNQSIDNISARTGMARSTIIYWQTYLRRVCSEIIQRKPKMRGSREHPIEIDESRFAGRRKYNRGRMLDGDHRAESEDGEVVLQNQRNHGRRIDGPWVFGLKKGRDCRYFFVNKRDRNTLIPIIQREVEVGSCIISDEWPAYNILGQLGYDHDTVCHQTEYVNHLTGAHTQTIERSWLESKIMIMKNKRGVPSENLQSHLDHFCWMEANRGNDLFIAMLHDIRLVFGN